MINIDDILMEKKISRTNLAKKIGISRFRLYGILNGNPTLENLRKLAFALNIHISELFEKQENDFISCPNCGTKLIVSEKK